MGVSDESARRPHRPKAYAEALDRFWGLWLLQEGYLTRLSLRWMRGNAADAEDALSAAKIQAARRFPCLEHLIVNPRAWLARVLHNVCMDHYRRRERAGRLEPEGAVGTSRPHEPPHPEGDLLVRERWRRIARILGSLPTPWSEALTERCLHDRSYRDLAERLATSEANVRKRVQLARKQLRESLDD